MLEFLINSGSLDRSIFSEIFEKAVFKLIGRYEDLASFMCVYTVFVSWNEFLNFPLLRHSSYAKIFYLCWIFLVALKYVLNNNKKKGHIFPFHTVSSVICTNHVCVCVSVWVVKRIFSLSEGWYGALLIFRRKIVKMKNKKKLKKWSPGISLVKKNGRKNSCDSDKGRRISLFLGGRSNR